MTIAMDWLRQTRRTYFGNAAAQRDYRVQLRGNRSVLLFGLYLAILIGVAFFKYSEIAGATLSVTTAQRQLHDFYMIVMMLLGGMVSIVTPGLAATAIVQERQRRSLDLVLCAPVEPRYYLVGKAIGVYRYVWMLLVLSLPVTAACVVLGGASWSDVLTVYGLFSIHGLLLAAIGLLVSTLALRPISAIVWSYAAVGVYLYASGVAAAVAISSSRYLNGPDVSDNWSFLTAMNPFTATYAVGTQTTLLGHAVPSALLGAAAVLVAVRLCLLGAGSVLSEGREIANLRLHWALVVAATAFGLGAWLVSSGTYARFAVNGVAFGARDGRPLVLGYGLFWLISPLLFVLPTIATYGADGAGRNRANGWFSVRCSFDGTPAGALPYVTLLIGLAVSFGLGGLAVAGGGAPSLAIAPYVLYTIGFWTFFWGIARVASSYGMGLRAARTTTVAAFVVLTILPAPFLMALTARDSFNQAGTTPWDLYLLRPVLQFNGVNPALPVVYGTALLALGLGLNAWSERNRLRSVVAVA